MKLFLLIVTFALLVVFGLALPMTDPEKQCSRENEEWKDCGSACPNTCVTIRLKHHLMCPDVCVEGCFCKRGFVRRGTPSDLARAVDCIPQAECLN